jgi:hypothetical protein
VIEGAIPGGAHEIGAEALLHLERLAPAPQLEHHLLRDLLSGPLFADNRLGEPHQTRIVRAKNGVECPLVTSPDSRLEVPVVAVVRVQGG